VLKPFNLKIFTSYNFVRTNSVRIISNNLIGNYSNPNNDQTAYLFLTPHLDNPNFDLHFLNFFETLDKQKKLNLYPNHTIKFGNPIFSNKEINNEILKDENSCICDHPLIDRIDVPQSKSFKHLGIIYF